MDSSAPLPILQRVKHRAFRARYAAEDSLRSMYIGSFAWIGSVEPCTGVLCETCQRCLRDLLILNVRNVRHHATASSMLAAVRIGCRICTCLWRQFARVNRIDTDNVPREMNERPRGFSRFWSLWGHSTSFVVWNTSWSNLPSWDLKTELKTSAIRNETLPAIELISYENDRIGLMNHYWKLARKWLSVCSSHHTRCKNVTPAEDYYPTRLIDVRLNSSDSELRLHATSNGLIKEPYMTLSHCWGKAQFLRLTSSTHDRLQQGFALAELPPTFQDAIMVTRALGVNFLWIDALCIIQDSIVDWQHEATMMSQVYSNSMCNISALDAQDSTGGLFFDRETSNIPYCTFTATRKFGRKRFYEYAYTNLWSDIVQHAPLTRRAWVVQERLLAPRVLHFGKRQLLWECNHLRACEVYPKGMHNTSKDFVDTDRFLKESITTSLHGVSDYRFTSNHLREAWNDLVQHYTRCNLTISKDKLVAISGIVKHLQPSFNTDYLAGLWRDDLLEQLLWHVKSYDGERRDLAGEQRPEYRAPSWSWASIDVSIGPLSNRVFGEIGLVTRKVQMATVIEAHITPVTKDATGQIADGYVRLRASLFPVNVYTSKLSHCSGLSWDWGKLESNTKTIPDIWPRSTVERLQFVPLLMQSIYYPELSLEVYGLILNPVEGKQGVYQRWGTASFSTPKGTDLSNFGIQEDYNELTYNPPEKYHEQVITLI